MQVKRSRGEAGCSYSMEVVMDQPRPACVLHWAVNDWTLPPQVGERLVVGERRGTCRVLARGSSM